MKSACWNFKARPKNYANGRKKPGLISFSVLLDLTKRRYSLFWKATSIIKDNPAVMFAFADTNYSLALKLNDYKFHYLNSKDELNKILEKCYFIFSSNQIHPVWFVVSSCCNILMTYLLFLQMCLLDIVFSCSKKTIICVDKIFNLFCYYWNLF